MAAQDTCTHMYIYAYAYVHLETYSWHLSFCRGAVTTHNYIDNVDSTLWKLDISYLWKCLMETALFCVINECVKEIIGKCKASP